MAYRSIGKALPRSGGQGGGKPVRKQFLLFVLTTLFLATVNPTHGQQTGKVAHIGFLDVSTASGIAVLLDAFRQELSKLGWIEGKNITLEYRFAEQKSEPLPELAADLVRLKVDLIVVTSGPSALAAKKATTSIPIVMANAGDPTDRRACRQKPVAGYLLPEGVC
jgi:putative ABC transport system substrate-binding protein